MRSSVLDVKLIALGLLTICYFFVTDAASSTIKLSEEEEIEAIQMFENCDEGGKGKLTDKELHAALVPVVKHLKEKDISTIFDALHKNHRNGSINKEEYLKLRSIAKAFKIVDEDEDGLISAFEFKNSLRAFSTTVTVQDATAIIDTADANGDHKFNYPEFVQFYMERGVFLRRE